MKTMINKEQCAEAQWDNDMPFGPKQTVGISGHYSEAQSGDDADSQVSVGNTNHNDCWRVRMGSPSLSTERRN